MHLGRILIPLDIFPPSPKLASYSTAMTKAFYIFHLHHIDLSGFDFKISYDYTYDYPVFQGEFLLERLVSKPSIEII